MPIMQETDWITHRMPGDDPVALLSREWLVTNGRGGYAMGTPAGRNDRRYHGLLVAATSPPVGRIVALNQVLDELHVEPPTDASINPAYAQTQVHEMATCGFADRGDPGRTVFAPEGHRKLERFERGLTVTWTYRFGGVRVRKELILHWQRPAATLRYDVAGLDDGRAATLRLRPLLTLRDFHAVSHAHDQLQVQPLDSGDAITARLHGVAVTLACPGAVWRDEPNWWYGLLYELDRERGQEYEEDAFAPGFFDVDLATVPSTAGGRTITLTVGLGEDPVLAKLDASDRMAHLVPILDHITGGWTPAKQTPGPPDVDERTGEQRAEQRSNPIHRSLALAGDDFVVRRSVAGRELWTILAGYPWFADWGRDTFIALPGLMLCTGRFEQARDVLAAFASSIRNGLVPNRFDDYQAEGDAAAHYNTVDASLWFVHAAMQYRHAADDDQAWRDWLAEACIAVVDAYIAGTDNDIAMTSDGLITAGGPETQLTWMDAACGGVVFTPRHGKAVEINALWHNALAGLAEVLPASFADKAGHYGKIATRTRRSFAKTFWNDVDECLFDHVPPPPDSENWADATPDRTVRPNQVFACSLPWSPLPATKQRCVLEVVRKQLLTPVGLRTLPTKDPNFHPRYTGSQQQRDEAYHQGTIWGWLIGPYAEGLLRTERFTGNARARARGAITPLLDRLTGEGLGQLAEVFEAQPDDHGHHRAVGCMAQAWSVAEVLRVLTLIERGEKE